MTQTAPEGAPELGEEYPRFLAALAEYVERRLAREGFDRSRARTIGFDVAEYMRLTWGGTKGYVPKGWKYELRWRDQAIYAKFKGRNLDELAAEYRLTPMRVRQIINAVRRSRRASGR